jgi:NADH-quinone oxidoreductase subunit C
MNEKLKKAAEAIKEAFGAEEHIFRDHVTLILDRKDIVPVCTMLRDKFDFQKLTDETAVDYYQRKTPRFHIVYQLHSIEEDLRLWLRAPVPEEDPIIDSIVDVYPNANWYEREIWDLFPL